MRSWVRRMISRRDQRSSIRTNNARTMATLVYTAIASLDGYIADDNGNFDWAAPDEDVHAFVNDLLRPIGTYLYGRRMYDVLRYWETAPTAGDETSHVEQDFAQIWQAADKIVYSTSLDAVSSARTRLERTFDPVAVRQMKAASHHDLAIGGPHLTAHALKAGLVDELHMILTPVVVGGGNPALPAGLFLELTLLDERRFDNGSVHLHYRVTTDDVGDDRRVPQPS
jgi:dihydrofolate reductase